MHRRDFLKFQAAAALSIGAAALGFPTQLLADASPDIAVVKGSPAAVTRAAVELLGGMSAFVRPDQKVVIKPNMSFTADVASATNTHPEVVRELLVMCIEAGAGTVRILDHAFQSGTQPLERSGILDACNGVRNGVCHNLTHERYYQETTLNDARDIKTNAVMNDVLAADVLIAAPVAKTNTSTGVSLSLKGQIAMSCTGVTTLIRPSSIDLSPSQPRGTPRRRARISGRVRGRQQAKKHHAGIGAGTAAEPHRRGADQRHHLRIRLRHRRDDVLGTLRNHFP